MQDKKVLMSISDVKIRGLSVQEEYIVLGIESSCDETALAVIKGRAGKKPEILSEVIFSQIEHHAPYSGVVPEIAARAHAERMPSLLRETMKQSGIDFKDLSCVAATSCPGLIGGVIVGLMTAKGICVAANKPLVAVNHLEGHALSPKITEEIEFPYLLLLASGGHCQILIVYDVGKYEKLGETIDDAAGEAFDKVAKMLNLGFPGGPYVEQSARNGNENRFPLPYPLRGTDEPNFSFSGLKTATLRIIESGQVKNAQDISDLCASFQRAVSICIEDRLNLAISMFKKKTGLNSAPLVIAGGVAANEYLRNSMQNIAIEHDMIFHAPPLKYCTDNGVMIAYAGLERFARGLISHLDTPAVARMPLSH